MGPPLKPYWLLLEPPGDSARTPFFFAYVNDLPQNVQLKVHPFADDTTKFLALTSSQHSETLQKDLHALEK